MYDSFCAGEWELIDFPNVQEVLFSEYGLVERGDLLSFTTSSFSLTFVFLDF